MDNASHSDYRTISYSPSPKLVKVFVSYSRDSKQHEEDVLRFADRLSKDGLDCIFDQYIESPPQGWPIWMTEQTEKAHFILVICTEAYMYRACREATLGEGKGVKFETLLTLQDLLDGDSTSSRLIPVLLKSSDAKFIPRPLRSFTRYSIDTEQGYEELYRRLTAQPKIIRPDSEGLRHLPTGVNIETDKVPFNIKVQQLRSQPEPNDSTLPDCSTVEVTIAVEYGEYTEEEQAQLLKAIGEFMKIGRGDIKIKNKRRGSVILTLEVPSVKIPLLLASFAMGKLEQYHVVNVSILDDTALESTATPKSQTKSRPQHRVKGTIKWFNDRKGFGFIRLDSGEDVFVHHSALQEAGFRTPKEGESVEFDIVNGAKGPQAANVHQLLRLSFDPLE
ncbi:MAG: cold shock domain-containing protein [Nitrospira sp.]|nr:cold shock domain-containing protein [Nitrospira sp.]